MLKSPTTLSAGYTIKTGNTTKRKPTQTKVSKKKAGTTNTELYSLHNKAIWRMISTISCSSNTHKPKCVRLVKAEW